MAEEQIGAAAEVQPATPGEYSAFIEQLEIGGIFLHKSRLENKVGPAMPDQANIHIQGRSGFANQEGGFRALQLYEVRLRPADDPDALLLDLDVEFAVDYRSQLPMTEPLFMRFKDINLPLNTWPYLREYLASTMGRLNWTPYTLPAYLVSSRPVLKRAAQGRKAPSRKKAPPAG